jgi:hypothetical protein
VSKKLTNLKEGQEVFPGIFVYDNVINNSKKLIKLALSNRNDWVDSRINGSMETDSPGVVDKNIRNTKILHFPGIYSNDIEWFKVSQIIWRYADKYGADNEAAFSGMETIQLLHYSSGQGFYKPHSDSGPGMHRIFSAILYLNDVNEGGETYFNKFDVSVKARAGRLAIFPADYVYTHEAKPPISNDKFALVTWFHPL